MSVKPNDSVVVVVVRSFARGIKQVGSVGSGVISFLTTTCFL